MDTISKQVLSFYNAQNNFVNIYYALGGKGEKTSVKNGARTKGKTKTAITLADITAIKYSGDGIDALNGITLAREFGFMDNPAFEI